jgi:hypothetical protein
MVEPSSVAALTIDVPDAGHGNQESRFGSVKADAATRSKTACSGYVQRIAE